MTLGPPAGWYPDPNDQRFLRWWDGRVWTERIWSRENEAYGPSGAYQYRRSPAQLYASETGLSRAVRVVVIAFPTLQIAAGFLTLAAASRWSQYFHSLRVFVQTSQTGATPPTVPTNEPHWSLVLVPFTVACEVVFALWQYHAARTARSLGYPARISPALGAWSYIIPVVQLWFPYLAIRDCLPPDHPDRPRVLSLWLLIIATAVLNGALVIAMAEAKEAGVVILVVNTALLTLLILIGWRVVDAISTNHRQTVGAEQ